MLSDKAPELRVAQWIDGAGNSMAPLTLEQLGANPKVIFCFQHWCPGCQSAGFPTLQRLLPALEQLGVGFAVVQTVFEGFEQNTFKQLRENQQRYELICRLGMTPSRVAVRQSWKTTRRVARRGLS